MAAIDYFSYKNPFLKFKTYFSLVARRKMYDRFIQLLNPSENDEVLDLGTTPDVELADSNFFEKIYPFKSKITIASIEDCEFLVEAYGLKCFKKNESKERFPFKDNEFDILFSSAVLEHVGTREDQVYFINECLRVSRHVFLTTPYRYFPLEMHTFVLFLHWLPWSIFQRIVRHKNNGFWSDINNLNLLSIHDIRKMGIKEIDVEAIRTCGMRSNLIIYGSGQER